MEIVYDTRTFFKNQGVTVDTQILRGIDPAESIITFSMNDYDLIVMGARGKNEKESYAVGSVTKKVIRHSTCPILVVKTMCHLTNVLVCIDGSEHATQALKYVVSLIDKMRAKITLLNVQERQFHDFSSLAHTVSEKLGETILNKALDTIDQEALTVDNRVVFGVPSDIIVEIADREKYDLIVLGNRGLGAVKRFLLGSVRDDVSLKAKGSVIIFSAKQ
jgi:nucleotide-binding universal stress UspA family protein